MYYMPFLRTLLKAIYAKMNFKIKLNKSLVAAFSIKTWETNFLKSVYNIQK